MALTATFTVTQPAGSITPIDPPIGGKRLSFSISNAINTGTGASVYDYGCDVEVTTESPSGTSHLITLNSRTKPNASVSFVEKARFRVSGASYSTSSMGVAHVANYSCTGELVWITDTTVIDIKILGGLQ